MGAMVTPELQAERNTWRHSADVRGAAANPHEGTEGSPHSQEKSLHGACCAPIPICKAETHTAQDTHTRRCEDTTRAQQTGKRRPADSKSITCFLLLNQVNYLFMHKTQVIVC